jgi:hypothetical protein
MIQVDNHYQHRLQSWQKPLYNNEEMLCIFLVSVWPVMIISMVLSLFNGW